MLRIYKSVILNMFIIHCYYYLNNFFILNIGIQIGILIYKKYSELMDLGS